MEQGSRSDSTLVSARQTQAEHIHDPKREPDSEAAITQILQAPVDPDAPDTGAEPQFGYITRPPNVHPDTYGLLIDENGAGLRMPPGAIVIVEPVPPRGRDLCVAYAESRRPSVWQIGGSFEPSFLLPPSEDSELHPMIEVFDPCDGHRGHLDARKITKLHRVVSIQTSVEVMEKYGPGPADLPLRTEVPDGCVQHVVDSAKNYPVLREGDTAIIDPRRTALRHGSLVLLQWDNGIRSILQTNRRKVGGSGPHWCLDPVNRPQGPGMMEKRQARGRLLYASDGPYRAKFLQPKIVGKVIGILGRTGKDGATGEAVPSVEPPKLMSAAAATDTGASLRDLDFTPWDMNGPCPIPTRDQWIECAKTALPWLRLAFAFMCRSKDDLGRALCAMDDDEFAALIESLEREQRQFRQIADMAQFALRRMEVAMEAKLDASSATTTAAA